MKILLLILCLGLSFNSSAQRKKKKDKKQSTYLRVQGGLLIDRHPQVDYLGFNQINIGLDRIKKNSYQGISLEAIRYTTEYPAELGPSQFPTAWTKVRTSFELEYFRSLLHVGRSKNGLYIGPTASILIRNRLFVGNQPSLIPFQERCYCIGLGGKAFYLVGLTNRLSLTIGTKITLFDLGLSRYTNMDPNLPIVQQSSNGFDFDLGRSQYQLLIGLNFKL